VPGRVPYAGGFRWQGVEVHPYKAEATHFRGVTRQLLFAEGAGASELRYFEVAPGGYTTLERHEHAHQVMVLRGRGKALLGNDIVGLEAFDLVGVPPLAWHQFRADAGEALGFLCLVGRDRDRPQRPDEPQLAALRLEPEISAFIRV